MRKKKKVMRKKRYGLSIFLMVLTLFAGGFLIAALIYLNQIGTLEPFLIKMRELLIEGGIVSVFYSFWVLAVPILLILLLVVNFKRRKRIRQITSVWKEAVTIAAERYEEHKRAEEEEKKNMPSRFGFLKELDSRSVVNVPSSGKELTLKELCENFRIFAAEKLGLYYSISDIRQFISSIAVSRIIILQGLSGTGKTSLAYAFGQYIENPSTIIPVQPMWKERTDLLGYYNEFTKRFNETTLLQKMYEANKSNAIYITVLDEMNIARVEYYFAEFLSLLEIPNPDSRNLEVVSDKWDNDPADLIDGRIRLPKNMWFIGTANNDDSTFAISDKVYDRAMILNLNHKCAPFYTINMGRTLSNAISYDDFSAMVKKALDEYEIVARNERRLEALDRYMIEKFRTTFGNRIRKQIRSYIAIYCSCGGDELEALDDILAKKVFRKLESQNTSYFNSEAPQLHEFLRDLFGATNMPRCHEYIDRIAQGA